MLRTALATALLLLGSLSAPVAQAEEATYRLPSDTAFILNLDLQAVRKSEVGGRLLGVVVDKAIEKIAEKGNTDREAALKQVEDILGFNPLEEVKSITVSAADYEEPENSLVAVVRLGKTTGNLEGLLLGLPEYAVADYEGQQIHSAAPEDGQTLYVAFVTDEAGDRRILFSSQRDAVTNLLDQAAGKSASGDAASDFTVEQSDNRLISLKVNKLPADAVEEGPPANIAKILKDASVSIDEADGRVGVNVALAAATEEQAEQLRQMAQGSIAMIQFAQTANPEDQDLKKISGMLKDAVASRDGTTVKVNVQLPAAEVAAMIDEKLKDK
jgi:hypothetical protein